MDGMNFRLFFSKKERFGKGKGRKQGCSLVRSFWLLVEYGDDFFFGSNSFLPFWLQREMNEKGEVF